MRRIRKGLGVVKLFSLSLSSLSPGKGDLVATSHPAATPLAPPASDHLSGVGGWWGARSRRPVRSLASRFPFLVLLGLGLHFPPTDFGAEVEAGCTTLWWEGVSGAVVVELVIPRSPTMASPLLLRADFDLDVRHLGAALLPLMSMVEFLVPVADSLCQRIRNLQACDDAGVPTELLRGSFASSFSDLRRGRLSFVPLFCESVCSFGSIPDGGGGLVFRSLVV
jgi:hypothetical protein